MHLLRVNVFIKSVDSWCTVYFLGSRCFLTVCGHGWFVLVLCVFRHVWEKGGLAIDVKSSPRLRVDANGTLHISQTWSGDIGTYTCRVTSVGGNDSRSAYLRVRSRPSSILLFPLCPSPMADYRMAHSFSVSPLCIIDFWLFDLLVNRTLGAMNVVILLYFLHAQPCQWAFIDFVIINNLQFIRLTSHFECLWHFASLHCQHWQAYVLQSLSDTKKKVQING